MAGSKTVDLPFLQSVIDKNEPGVKLTSYEVSTLKKNGLKIKREIVLRKL